LFATNPAIMMIQDKLLPMLAAGTKALRITNKG